MTVEFWKTFASFVASFIAMRLMAQTDLVMLAPLGHEALAAFAIPNRIMFLDSIVAFGIGPVASVLVSRAPVDKRSEVAAQVISNTFFLSTIVALACLVIYPLVVERTVLEPSVAKLAKLGVLWLTVSIPVRMLVFVATMCLFAGGVRKPVIAVYVITVLANGLLNWLLIYKLGLGFQGSYMATGLVSCIELGWLLLALKRHMKADLLVMPSLAWIRDVYRKIGAEWVRLVSWQAEALIVVASLASMWPQQSALAAFGVSSELSALLVMPLMALMRTIAVYQNNPQYKSASLGRMVEQLRAPLGVILAVYVLVGVLIFSFSQVMASQVYHLSGASLHWWHRYAQVYLLAFPCFVVSATLRGWLQSEGAFANLAAIDMSLTFALFLPAILAGAYLSEPLLFFGAYLVKDVAFSLIAFRAIRARSSASVDGALDLGVGKPAT